MPSDIAYNILELSVCHTLSNIEATRLSRYLKRDWVIIKFECKSEAEEIVFFLTTKLKKLNSLSWHN